MARKRGANEGSFQKIQDGRWRSAIGLGYENGKRRRKYFYGATEKEVRDKLFKAVCDKKQGLPVALERQTVGQYLKRWLAESVRGSVKPLTHEQYGQHVRLYIEPAIGKVQLSKLSPQQIEALKNAKLKDGLSARTVQITLFVLRRAFKQAVKWGQMVRNPAELVDLPRVEPPEVIPPTKDQVQTFLNKLKDERLGPLFTIGLALGLRRGELLGLRWMDIDLDNRTISVKQAVQRSGGKYTTGEPSKLHIVTPKSKSSIRTISMPPFVADAIRERKARQAEERLLAGSQWTDFNLVFTTGKGTPIEPRRADKEFKRILKKAELPETIRLHDLRHFAASLLLERGVHQGTMKEILGHSDISVTMNVYSHIGSELKRDAADRIEAAFAGK